VLNGTLRNQGQFYGVRLPPVPIKNLENNPMHSRMVIDNKGKFWARPAPPTAVFARLDRAIQYSETARLEPRSRGVLDAPLAAFAKASASLGLNPGEALA
jgi:hypothetical protein